eukprot:TRINITY_DN10015_c1_g1_i1.p1 TRINITY_DN10015_c1_g1~~TRINITY_DN10015_c1_g1_i1.p1  ORF type:complete len:811 (-),score=9.03 TRINITY_DN10015_c1_g1_i1:70-2334(-)
MTIEDNITYETKGHCFLLGEGAEMFNVFRRNLGINARKVVKVIPSATGNRLDFQTDQQPTTFWLATPFSSFYDNVAAGSEDSGFWLEANPYMRGLSRLLPRVGSRIPFYFNWGEYDGNTAHSNKFGFRTYPHGSKSRYPVNNGAITKLSNLLLYRNTFGIFFFNSERLEVQGGDFVDNAVGIDLSRNAGVSAQGCRFIINSCGASSTYSSASQKLAGLSTVSSFPPSLTPAPANDSTTGGGSDPTTPTAVNGPTTAWDMAALREALGPYNPYAMQAGGDGSNGTTDGGSTGSNGTGIGTGDATGNGTVASVASTASRPLATAAAAAAAAADITTSDYQAFGSAATPMGITLSQSNPQDGLMPNSVQDTLFSGYGKCSGNSFALALVANKAGGYWNTAMFVKGLRFAPRTNKFWATPNPSSGTPPRGGLVARYYALRDLDGSLLGKVATAVAPFTPVLPPASVLSSQCDAVPAISAYACESVCYRAIGLAYYEFGVRPQGSSGLPANVLRPYSYLSITRVEDGQQFSEFGTDNDNPSNRPAGTRTVRRYLTASLLAGYTYRIQIVPADTNQLFFPESARVVAYDAGGCAGSVKVILVPRNGTSQWTTTAPAIPCSSLNPKTTYQQQVCVSSKSFLQLTVGAQSYGTVASINLSPVASLACSSGSACSSSIRSTPVTALTADPLANVPLPPDAPSTTVTGNTDPFFDPGFYGDAPDGGADGGGALGNNTGTGVSAYSTKAASIGVVPQEWLREHRV